MHIDCGCYECRIAIADKLLELIQLSPAQYMAILESGKVEC